jgi:hypothetical protein
LMFHEEGVDEKGLCAVVTCALCWLVLCYELTLCVCV